ncbi:hypothetical protein [Rhizobium sp. L1K21]|uniref:hypothetical protein n=1 Tax=Rhizobium sp. L1K21 TaxID=2954933 RepID=UPI0020926838|nr:hypothetical protein [Rhizobium sp. L1K21]MCO6185482.1 hypothetical protein [Rhizobium sp. L1K21]
MDPISITIALIAGVLAGNILSAAMKQDSINFVWRTVFGAGGGIIGFIFFGALNGNGTVTGPLVDIYTGAFGGAILTAIAGAVMAPIFPKKR